MMMHCPILSDSSRIYPLPSLACFSRAAGTVEMTNETSFDFMMSGAAPLSQFVSKDVLDSSLASKLDSVYFFMWPGWRNELESNRWHWSKRWSQRLPVVLIQPELPFGKAARSEPERRLRNVELLSINRHAKDSDWLAVGLKQVGQIACHMAARSHKRPLFWCYNPHLTVPYVLLPACARVFHATENYFDFSETGEHWLNLYRAAIEAANITICCSSGVAESLSKHTEAKNLLTLPNGCDFFKYSRPASAQGKWQSKLGKWQHSNERLAIFAGNINNRLDFELIESLVAGFPTVGFVFAGPVHFDHLSGAQRTKWARLLRAKNFLALGRIAPEDLPAIYWRCDVGLIPYVNNDPLIVENGFPLKALEMAAAGLPVVSTLMKPLQAVSGAVTVVTNAEAFRAAVATHSRAARTDHEQGSIEQICRAYDYDVLFERMLEAVKPHLGGGECRLADLSGLIERVGVQCYQNATIQVGDYRSRRITYWLGYMAAKVPKRLRQRIPEPIRSVFRPFLS
jgi:glycosyltransferase involved in cell wall biosynthesis